MNEAVTFVKFIFCLKIFKGDFRRSKSCTFVQISILIYRAAETEVISGVTSSPDINVVSRNGEKALLTSRALYSKSFLERERK